MLRKPKFKPEVTRIKLNPEQAVLTCLCWDVGKIGIGRAGNEPGAQFACYQSQGPIPPVKTVQERTINWAYDSATS